MLLEVSKMKKQQWPIQPIIMRLALNRVDLPKPHFSNRQKMYIRPGPGIILSVLCQVLKTHGPR